VKSAATVHEALDLINKESFDVLISDLNIGYPGDGFTVVSAMRRVQPQAITFILTGYPEFESALEAIRNQVDDYLTKPADILSLVATLERKLETRRPQRSISIKRVPEFLLDNLEQILQRWLIKIREIPELRKIPLSPKERLDSVPEIIAGACSLVLRGKSFLDEITAAHGTEHGQSRHRQGYSADMIRVEIRLLQQAISQFLQENLLALDTGTLITDIMVIADLIGIASERSLDSFTSQSLAI
jgi:YesN/AraC family two-component response regulator